MPIIPLEELKKDKVLHARLLKNPLTFHTTWGLFCPEEIDQGTKLLLEHMPEISEDAHVLDIGCGYGPIGISIAAHTPNGSVEMIDKDFVAVEYTQKNIELNKNILGTAHTKAYLSNGFSHVPKDKKYTHIISNLPAKVSKEFFWILFGEAHQHLQENGEFIVVAIRQLEPMLKKSFEAVFGNFEILGTDKVYSVVRTKNTSL